MRKVLAILLCVAILLPCVCVGVSAEENHTFYKINIDSGNGTIGEKTIVKDGEIYISADSFSNYTRFSFDNETKTFLIKGQELNKAFKSVVIDIEKKRVFVSGKKFFDLSDCFEIEGEVYLPLCQMLPILNADIYEVKDSVIYISNNKLSLAEVLYDFDISDYYFNISTEFSDMDWAALLTIVPNYVLDTVVNGRFDRLDILYNSGECNDYKDAFSDFLSDDNLYLKAMAENASAIGSTVEFFNKANSTAKNMKSVYGWVEAAGKSEISSETGGALLDSLKAYYDSGDLKTDDIKGLNDAWTGGKISFGDCIEILTYAYTYATQVEDNRQMLNAVYNVDSKVSKKETARKAAKQVYDLYGDNIIPALYKEIATTVASDTLKDLSPIGVYTATAKVAGVVLETFIPFKPGGIAKLPVYSDVVLSAASKYSSYDTLTDDSTENLRLSLLLCMIASKKCYEVMADVFDDDPSYYKNKIENLEQMIMGLYIAEENTDFDSFEHFEEYEEKNIKKIKPVLETVEVYPEIINKVPVGIYHCSTDGCERDSFTIHSINENEVKFSVEWVRINGIDNAIVEISGTKGNFTWEKESGEYVVGQIEFIDEKTIILSIKETTLYEIEPKAYKYEYFGTEEDEAVAYNKMVLLDHQSESCGWSRTTDYDIHGKTKDMFIRFNSDGSMIYWVGEPLGGDTFYTKFTEKYKITKDTLYINNCAYSLYAYTAGSTIMTLKALGDYEIDFSGEYFCENDEMFQFLYADN